MRPPLEALGKRIVVLGPSNAGKSTLAIALAEKLGCEAIHLDQLRFEPNQNWKERSEEAFAELHDKAIAGESWVIEGNYSSLLPTRLERATGIVILNASPWKRLARYMRRISTRGRSRQGAPIGAEDRFTWEMLFWVLSKSHGKTARYISLTEHAGKPTAIVRSSPSLFAEWGLTKPS